jgi:DNA-directed RNA polymerase subunit RPC12/RpoP
MSNPTVGIHTPTPPPGTTVWYCRRCEALVSIRSAYALDEAFCPACGRVPLVYFGAVNSMPDLQIGEA